MEHRSLRLGDIVDDYCPRERRITNHAIVAMVGEDIRQTRCTTCEAEHVFKGARGPRKRTRGNGEDHEANLAGGQLVHPRVAPPEPESLPDGADMIEAAEADAGKAIDAEAASQAPDSGATNGESEASDEPADGWLAHRPLIRATLPRTEGEPPPARAIPEFTMHQRQPRGGRGFQHGWRGGHGNGSGPGGNSFRSGGEPDGNRAPGHGGGKPGRRRGGRHRRRR